MKLRTFIYIFTIYTFSVAIFTSMIEHYGLEIGISAILTIQALHLAYNITERKK